MFQQREFRFIFEWAHRPVIFSIIIQAFLVAAFGLIHSCHVSTMFENDTYFSHLTTLEREMIFRSEMGMYYSYYKRLVQAPSYLDGLIEIINDRKTEYPSVINSLQRFNLFPEVVIAALFRVSSWISKALDLKTIECWIVNRTYDDVTSCVGYGDPIYFYLYTVWACAGLTMSLIFLFGLELSGSILGGTFAVLCFMFNHSESTRIQWTPPLRESFGYPCSLWQMLIVTKFLRFANSYKGMVRNQQSLTNWLSNISRIMLPTTIFLILWQFSQFVITTQLLAVYLLYCFGVIGRQTCLTIAISVAGSIVVASVILFFNEFLLYSTLTFLAMAMVIVVHLDPLFERTKFSCAVLSTVSIAVLTLLLKFIYGNRDDAHIFNLLRTKFTDYKDFHTLLYTCSPEFDFMPASYLKKISQTLLMPTVVFNVIAVTWYWLMTVFHSSKRSPSAKVRSVVDPAIAYNFLQANAFAVMAALVMRLKLFLTPHLCLIASIIFHKQFLPRTPKPWFSAFIALLVGGMTVQGYANIVHERNIIGEFTNTPLEELLTWIMDSTDTNAVFAGPMPVMANVMLSTGRQVVNHPHYEHAEARNRTLKAYSIFSRKSRYEVYDIMVKMHVQYVIIEDVWCFGVSKNGCSMGDLWDVQDPENMNQDLLCPALYRKSSFPFHKLFANGAYVVLKVDPQWSNSRLPSAIKIDQINVVNISISQNS